MLDCKLKEIRESKGMTQQALADASGVTRARLSEIENNHQVPKLETLAKIAKALGVGWHEIVVVVE